MIGHLGISGLILFFWVQCWLDLIIFYLLHWQWIRETFFFTFLYPIFLPPFYWDIIHIPYNLSIIISNWVLKNRCFQSVVLKTLESPLDNKETKPVNSKGNQPWIFIGRTDAEAPILCPPDSKSRLIVKHSNSGKD